MLAWRFRVAAYDVGFALRLRVQGDGGSSEVSQRGRAHGGGGLAVAPGDGGGVLSAACCDNPSMLLGQTLSPWLSRARSLARALSFSHRTSQVDVFGMQKYSAGVTVQGEWSPATDSALIVLWDNEYSYLREKTVAFQVRARDSGVASVTSAVVPSGSRGPLSLSSALFLDLRTCARVRACTITCCPPLGHLNPPPSLFSHRPT